MLFTSVVFAAGPRAFPGNSVQVQISPANSGYIVVNDQFQLALAPGVIIVNQANRTIVRGALPTGVMARIVLNGKDQVQRVWLLAEDEIESQPKVKFATRQRERPSINQQ